MTDAELGLKLVTALRAISNSRDVRGAPVKGKLTSLVLNIGSDDQWQAIAQFWLTNDWNVKVGKDPVACIVDVLTAQVDLSEPYDPKKRLATYAKPVLPASETMVAGKAADLGSMLSVAAGERVILNHVAAKAGDDGDLEDLLV